MSGSQPVAQFTGCHRDTTPCCHGEHLDWIPVGVNNHQVSAKKGREERSSERLPAAISGRVVSAAALARAGARSRNADYIMIVGLGRVVNFNGHDLLCLSILVTKTIHTPLQSHKLLQDVFHIAVNDHSLSANSSAHSFKHIGQLGAFDRCL